MGRVLAIGDIHGCLRALKTLEKAVGISEADQVITLGDYVHRGPDAPGVLDWLIQHCDNGLVPLRGNHEVMFLEEEVGRSIPEGFRKSHVSFLRKRLAPFYETETHLFVHASVDASLPMCDQPEYMLYWENFGNQPQHQSGKILVCGHTWQRSGLPLDLGHSICIDTGACRDRWLTCLDVNARYCWQANERGGSREFWLDQPPQCNGD